MEITEHEMKALQEMLTATIRQELAGIEDRVTGIEGEMSGIEDRMTRLEVSCENNTRRIINLLQEDYSRVAATTVKFSAYNNVKSKVREHQQALENRNQRIDKLEKKAI